MKQVTTEGFWAFRITARHLLQNLGTELYGEPGKCLWELARNGVCACMPGDDWKPGVGHVEIQLDNNHPLAPKSRALVVFDRGSGFTRPKIGLYCYLGPSLEDSRQSKSGTHQGASQKRIGRFSAYGLNKACLEGDTSSGFYILSRTSETGPVTFVAMIPESIEKDQGVKVTTVGPNAAELGPYRGITGSFTAIVIPNSVFENYDEIREALEWQVPRKRDKMFTLMVGGKRLAPPSLASKVTSAAVKGDVDVFVDRLPSVNGLGGIWLSDAHTGLRVACCKFLTHALPYPLWRSDFVGDIFVPDLLVNQDTSRSGLTARFLKSAAWKKLVSYLALHVAPRLKALLGDEDAFNDRGVGKLVLDMVETFHDLWGVPTGMSGSSGDLTGGGSGDGKGRASSADPPEPRVRGEGEPKPRVLGIKVGDEVFRLARRQLDPHMLAQVDETGRADARIIYLNVGQYAAMPTTQAARAEHIVLKVLEAVGRARYPSNPDAVTVFVAEKRIELLKHRGDSVKS